MIKKLNEAQKELLREHWKKKELSKSEIVVCILTLQGYINLQIAKKLCVAEKTIKYHLGNSFKKLGVHRRQHLVWTIPLEEMLSLKHCGDEPLPPPKEREKKIIEKGPNLPRGSGETFDSEAVNLAG